MRRSNESARFFYPSREIYRSMVAIEGDLFQAYHPIRSAVFDRLEAEARSLIRRTNRTRFSIPRTEVQNCLDFYDHSPDNPRNDRPI